MPSVSESLGKQNPLKASLDAGIENTSQHQFITFKKYVKFVLPLDGFIFWIRADLVTDPTPSAKVIKVKGSLHYATENTQAEDDSIAVNHVVFTAESEIQDFNEISAQVIYIASFQSIRFAFSRRKSFYQQAGIYHYGGDAIYPVMATQIIDDLADLDEHDLIVSNSLPIWLGLNRFMPMYPSFLMPDNIEPKYAAVHIAPEATEAIGATTLITRNSSSYQLVKDKVQITMYGLNNNEAIDFLNYVFQYSVDYDTIGVMNMPTIRDAKRTQAELNIIAQKKTVEFEVSYYQERVTDVARQLILHATMSFQIDFIPEFDFNVAANSQNLVLLAGF